jgi:hypothetical protein
MSGIDPQPGPQEQFRADIAKYGRAAGGGKDDVRRANEPLLVVIFAALSLRQKNFFLADKGGRCIARATQSAQRL